MEVIINFNWELASKRDSKPKYWVDSLNHTALVFEKSGQFQSRKIWWRDGVKSWPTMEYRNVYRISQLLWSWIMYDSEGRERKALRWNLDEHRICPLLCCLDVQLMFSATYEDQTPVWAEHGSILWQRGDIPNFSKQ